MGAVRRMVLHLSPSCLGRVGLQCLPLVSYFLVSYFFPLSDSTLASHCPLVRYGCCAPHDFTLLSHYLLVRCGCFGPHDCTVASHLSPLVSTFPLTVVAHSSASKAVCAVVCIRVHAVSWCMLWAASLASTCLPLVHACLQYALGSGWCPTYFQPVFQLWLPWTGEYLFAIFALSLEQKNFSCLPLFPLLSHFCFSAVATLVPCLFSDCLCSHFLLPMVSWQPPGWRLILFGVNTGITVYGMTV